MLTQVAEDTYDSSAVLARPLLYWKAVLNPTRLSRREEWLWQCSQSSRLSMVIPSKYRRGGNGKGSLGLGSDRRATTLRNCTPKVVHLQRTGCRRCSSGSMWSYGRHIASTADASSAMCISMGETSPITFPSMQRRKIEARVLRLVPSNKTAPAMNPCCGLRVSFALTERPRCHETSE